MVERNDVGSPEHPGRSAEEIRQDIAAKRESISSTVDRLGDRIQETLDWREYVYRYPYVALGVAAGLGYLVSGMFRAKPTPRERIMDAFAESVEDLTDNLGSTLRGVVIKAARPSVIKATVAGLLTKAALEMLKRNFAAPRERQTTSVH